MKEAEAILNLHCKSKWKSSSDSEGFWLGQESCKLISKHFKWHFYTIKIKSFICEFAILGHGPDFLCWWCILSVSPWQRMHRQHQQHPISSFSNIPMSIHTNILTLFSVVSQADHSFCTLCHSWNCSPCQLVPWTGRGILLWNGSWGFMSL